MSESHADAFNAAVRLLAQREHARAELSSKLSRKSDVSSAELEAVLDALEAAGYLDDRRFAEMFVRSSVSRGHGPMKIGYALRDKGVAEGLAREVLSACEADWLEQARWQREKKFGEEIPVDFKERARQSRFLAGRGFSIDTINAVFHEKC